VLAVAGMAGGQPTALLTDKLAERPGNEEAAAGEGDDKAKRKRSSSRRRSA
jgi:hypothetical protein